MTVTAALGRVEGAENFMPPGVRCIATPEVKPAQWRSPPVSLAEVLNMQAFADADVLRTRVAWWKGLVLELEPTALLADMAHVALLATWRTHLPRFVLTNGWGHPPQGRPMPAFSSVPPDVVRQHEAKALTTIQAAGVPLRRLCDLFDVDLEMYTCFPELDHYTRPLGHHVGAVLTTTGAEFSGWPPGRPRVYAYLRRDDPRTVPVLEGLLALGASVIAVVRGGLDLTSPNLLVHDGPMRLDEVREQADLAVSHSVASTATNFFCAGTPVLLLPIFTEQRTLAEIATSLGVSVFSTQVPTSADVATWVHELTTSRKVKRALKRFSRRHGDVGPDDAIDEAARRILARLS